MSSNVITIVRAVQVWKKFSLMARVNRPKFDQDQNMVLDLQPPDDFSLSYYIQKQPPEVFCRKRWCRPATLSKESPMKLFSCDSYEIFRNNYFKEILRTTSSICRCLLSIFLKKLYFEFLNVTFYTVDLYWQGTHLKSPWNSTVSRSNVKWNEVKLSINLKFF